MAKSIAQTLSTLTPDSPMALLELNYHYADRYEPSLHFISEDELEEKLADNEQVFPITFDYDDMLQTDTTTFERSFAQMERMMDQRDDYAIGRIILRKAAALLTTTKCFGQVYVAKDFAAYAVDWSIEGHSNEDIEGIMAECGLTEERIAEWKAKGILEE